MSTPNVNAQPPRNVLFKPVTADFKSLFGALGKGIGHTATGNWWELGNDAAAALSSLGLQNDPGQLAWVLIRRALMLAMFELVGESASLQLAEVKKTAADLETAFESLPSSTEIVIDRRFFDRPGDLPLLDDVAALLQQWLALAGIGSYVAAAIAKRLPAYFVFALNQEWRRRAKEYAPLLEVATPFADAGERELGWRAYTSLLQRRIEEGVFDEPFSLQQLYVPLRAYYTEETQSRGPLDDVRAQKPRRVVVDLEEALNEWIAKPDPQNAIRVISGGPGSGKSSFARVFAARASIRTLFIPLHLLDTDRDLTEAVERFVRDEGLLVANPLSADSPEPNLLIIFDGLDELASQGAVAVDAARAFIREVEKTVEKRNTNGVKLRVLISGRELVVQGNESELRRPRQILNLLPYYVRGEDLEGEQGLLEVDQRQEWWRRYGEASGRPYEALPEALSREDLEEITAQPLLNYLVALSFKRGKVDFEKSVNLNEIYFDLVQAVHARAYEKRAHAAIRHMTFNEFLLILEEIGLAAWHGDGRTTTVREIEEHCQKSNVAQLLDKFKEGAQAGVTRLLAAFFFRQYGRRAGGDPTFVFTHKSFGEYLAARRILRAMGRMTRERKTSQESPGEGFSERDALRHWAEICGPSAMTAYLRTFLLSEVRLQRDDDVASIQDEFTNLFSYVLRHSLPMELLQLPTFEQALMHDRNAEEALLAALNACARRMERISRISHPDKLAFGTWLKRMQRQLSAVHVDVRIVMSCLSYLDLSGLRLIYSDLAGADFSHSNLSDTSIGISMCYQANFDDADLSNADVSGCYLLGASLRRAKIHGASLGDSDLAYATLDGASIRNSDLRNVMLHDASFADVDADLDARIALGLEPPPDKPAA